eukprot:EG_transcript_3496
MFSHHHKDHGGVPLFERLEKAGAALWTDITAFDKGWEEPESGTPVIGVLFVKVHQARNLKNKDLFGVSDPFVRLIVDGKEGPRTTTKKNTLTPVWEEKLEMYLGSKVSTVTFSVRDEDVGVDDALGTCHIPIADVLENNTQAIWCELDPKGELQVSITFVPSCQEYSSDEVPSPFPERECNRVTLYQDAHVPADAPIPDVLVAGDTVYPKFNCLWETVYRQIQQAEVFIYITGWSVWSDLFLLREHPLGPEGFIKLGDLLKQKADAGVRVLCLVWDELMSLDSAAINKIVPLTQTGLMNTHDDTSKEFFKGTNVNFQLVMRHGRTQDQDGDSPVTKLLSVVGTEAIFTHHQKSIMCDAPASVPGQYRVVAFMGGLDLTTGRFDTAEHPPFRTLATWHKDDFYQGYGDYLSTAGPREPWHDVHCFLEGPVALDVIANFEARWKKQVPSDAEELVNLAAAPFVPADELALPATDPARWTCRIFRSIDSNSAIEPVPGIEKSIQQAYIQAIRQAQTFIYIENQYFMGSSEEWEGFEAVEFKIECKNRVPAELAAKVVAKIQAQERFAVYIVVPMHPEGKPEDKSIQDMLHWQYRTVQFMYKRIAAAIEAYGPAGAVPTDYLNFYFPGNRDPSAPAATGVTDQRQAAQLASKRQMVYVHSKLMIVDDDYIIMGSANINERSLAGNRDTEICVGMYQPEFRCTDGVLPMGQASGFRKSLWGEHTGVSEDVFSDPSSVACVARLNAIAENNWELFSSANVQAMPSHLCKYPYNVSAAGEVTAVQQYFPDMEEFHASVLGAVSCSVPTLLTT